MHQTSRPTDERGALLPALLLRISLRYLLRHAWQFGLCVLGVALGVAVVVSIDLTNASASRAFELSTESIAGRATHQVVGGPGGLDESLYRDLRVGLGLRQSAPIVEGYLSVPTMEGITMYLLGVDPLAEAPFRSYLGSVGGEATTSDTPVDLSVLLVEPATVLLAEQTAQRYGLELGDTLTLQVGSQQREVRLVGLLNPQDEQAQRTLEGTLIADIATAQEVLGEVGTLSRIDLILPDDEAAAEEVREALPTGAELTRPQARSNTLQQMTAAFELNLAALSLLALIVGVFLIYNTMTFSVVQRRELLGTLRCLGVTRRQVAALVLSEALLIGLAGALLGVLLGVLLGRSLIGLVTQTITDLYFVVTIRELALDPLVLLKGFALGVFATLGAALVPTREAMQAPPRVAQRRSSVEEGVRRMAPWAALAGGVLLLLGGVLLLLGGNVGDWRLVQGEWLLSTPSGALVSAFTALFLIVIGFALLTPGATMLLMRLLGPLLGRLFGLLGRMAARDAVASLSRTSVAIAALMVAVSVTIGVGIMVGSFRQTVVNWLDQSLQADIYVSSPSNTATRVDTTLDPAIVDDFAAVSGVEGQALFRAVQVETAIGPTTLVAIERDNRFRDAAPQYKQAGPEPLAALDDGAVFISEPLAYRLDLGVGDSLRLPTPEGARDFPIAAVYYDYTSDRGVIQMDYATYRATWNDPQISSFALYVTPDANIDRIVRDLREVAAASGQDLVIRSNQALRENTLMIFDRTFAITAVLQMLATIVAFIGILSALMALQLERGRELAMLRANGLTRRQLWGLVLSQTSLVGLTAGLLALPVGLVLALVLVFVINRRSFGWTLDLSLDPALFGQALLVALLAALLAGLYPAWRMAHTNPALALREE
jgi:putative ABC transport system permease protein